MEDKARPGFGAIQYESVQKFRSMLKNGSAYTDEELASVLSILGSFVSVFESMPAYLPGIIRASLISNEIAPTVLAPFVDAGVIDPVATQRYINQVAEKHGWKAPEKTRLN